MPAIDANRNTTAQPKKKVKRKVVAGPPAPKPKPVVVAPSPDAADRNRAARDAKRTQQLKTSVRKAGDAPQDRAPDQKRAQAYVKKQYDAEKGKVTRVAGRKVIAYKPGTTVPPDVAHAVALRTSTAAHKAEMAAKVAPVLKVLDQTTRPLHAVAAAAKEDVRTVKKEGLKHYLVHGTSGRGIKAAGKGIQNKDKSTFSDVFTEAGWKPKSGLGKFAKGAASLTADVVADPTTFVTGGTGAVVRKAATGVATREARGVVVKVAGKEVPGVRKATAKAGEGGGKAFRKVVPERARNAVRDAASEVNPNVAPAGVEKATHEAARQVARKARASTNQGQREAINLAHGIKTKIGKENYRKVTDAVEAGDLTTLPTHLQGHAETLRGHLATIRKVQRDAGVKVPERKGYVPRKLTPETIKAENKKAAQVGGRGKTEPGSSKARKEQRTLAEVRQTEPGRYREDLHALVAERMAEGTASAARANLAQDLAKLGHEVPRGSSPHLSEREALYRVKKGEDLKEVQPSDKKFRRPANGTGGPKYVVLNKALVDRTMGTVSASRGGTIAHGYDRAQGGFKRVALATPGFHIRNAIGDTAQAYVHQPGQKLPGNMIRAGRVLKAAGRIEKTQRSLGTTVKTGKGTLKTKHYGHVSYEEAAQKLIAAGAARSGYTSRELRDLATSGKKTLKLPKSPASVRRAFLNREDLPRLATAIHALRKGATYEEAAAKVADVHFDYADLTPFERDVARRIMPFYTWTARNVPLQTKRILTNPGKFANYQKVREEAGALVHPEAQDPKTRELYKQLEASGVKLTGGWEKYLTSYEQRNAGVPVSWKGHKFTVSAGLPLGDLNELPGMSGPGEYLNKAASLVTPLVKDPVEFGFNYSFFFRDQIERDNSPLVAAPSFVGKWPDGAKKKFGIVKAQDKRSGKMIWQWPGKADYVAHAVPGLPSTVVKMMTPGHDRQGKGTAAKALGVAGVKATPVDATTNAINMAIARGREIQKRQRVLRKQANPANGQLIGAKNPTPEYTRLSGQLRMVSQIAYQGKSQRKDAVLPTQGGPRKVRSSSGRVKVPGVSGRVKVPGVSARVKVP